VTPLLGDGPPTVLVHEGHLPLGVITSAGLFVVGIAFMFFCARRYRRTFEQSWIVLSITAALLVLLSAAALVTYAVRTLH
jgi:hypothetical protein